MFSPFLESLAKRHHMSWIFRGVKIIFQEVLGHQVLTGDDVGASHRSVMGVVFLNSRKPCHGTMVYLGEFLYIFNGNVGDFYINYGVKNLHLLVIFVVN